MCGLCKPHPTNIPRGWKTVILDAGSSLAFLELVWPNGPRCVQPDLESDERQRKAFRGQEIAAECRNAWGPTRLVPQQRQYYLSLRLYVLWIGRTRGHRGDSIPTILPQLDIPDLMGSWVARHGHRIKFAESIQGRLAKVHGGREVYPR